MYYVYILRSILNAKQTYIGFSSDVKKRLEYHNQGDCPHTKKYKPWKLIWYCGFPNKELAISFEKYLKTSSGIAFRNKRLILPN